jgi:pyruvate decarboxylase
MPSTVHLAEYLFTRLRQLGVQSVHGVPGDFNLQLLDYVEPSGLHWVGNCNELNAGYAADGYSRIKGLGAIVTTFGVGELSALNAIAGAFAERAPIVHIVGTPPRPLQDNRVSVHHTFNDGDHRRFIPLHSSITVVQACLRDPRDSPEKIDAALEQCLLHSRPVYIEVPLDMVSLPVPSSRLNRIVAIPETIPTETCDEALSIVLNRITECKQPMIFVDGESRAYGMVAEIKKFMEISKWPTWSSTFGKGLVNETLPNFHGVYMGSEKPHQKTFVDCCDFIMVFGPHYSTTNSYFLSAVPNSSVSVVFTATAVQIDGKKFLDLPPKWFLSQIIAALDGIPDLQRYSSYPELETPIGLVKSLGTVSDDQKITQKELYLRLSPFVRPGDIILAETGTAGWGAREIALPQQTSFFGPVTWLSIGYMLPAAQGAALAQRDSASKDKSVNGGRTIVLIGDGSFQMTVQELSTIIRENLNVICFVINNNGYTVERCIHGQNEKYNDIFMWRYLEAPSFFGAKESKSNTFTVRTWGDLAQVMADDNLANGEGLRMVEIIIERDDAPVGLLKLLEAQLQTEEEKRLVNGRT